MTAQEWTEQFIDFAIGNSQAFDDEYLQRAAQIGGRLYTEELTNEDAIFLAERAIDNEGAWKHLEAVCHLRLKRGLPLPIALSEFASLLVLGAKPPKKKGRRQNTDRNEFIAGMMVILCRKFDLKPTRSAEGKGKRPECAASILADRLKPPLSEAAVVTIWQNSKARRRYEECG